MPPKQPDTLRLNLRLPKALHRKLVQYVEGDLPQLSLQQEIVRRLENSFEDSRPSPETMDAIEAAAQAVADKVVERLKGADQC